MIYIIRIQILIHLLLVLCVQQYQNGYCVYENGEIIRKWNKCSFCLHAFIFVSCYMQQTNSYLI